MAGSILYSSFFLSLFVFAAGNFAFTYLQTPFFQPGAGLSYCYSLAPNYTYSHYYVLKHSSASMACNSLLLKALLVGNHRVILKTSRSSLDWKGMRLLDTRRNPNAKANRLYHMKWESLAEYLLYVLYVRK
jgi:hypothetical protein